MNEQELEELTTKVNPIRLASIKDTEGDYFAVHLKGSFIMVESSDRDGSVVLSFPCAQFPSIFKLLYEMADAIEQDGGTVER